jgi:uncharacterized protein YbcC (UPF0753/DUF2309 family)
LYYSGKKKEKTQKVNSQINKKDEKLDLSSFYLNKELEEINKLIDNVLQKLEKIFISENSNSVTPQKKEKLRQVYNEIIKLRKSTNISKLKEV